MKIRMVIPVIAAVWMVLSSASARAENDLGAASALPQFETERVIAPREGAPEVTSEGFPEKTKEAQLPKVGDQLLFRIKGASTPGLQAVSDSKQESLEDQGWAIVEVKPLANEPDLTVAVIPLKAGKVIFPSLALQDPSGKVVGRTAPVSVEISSAISSSDPKPDQPEDVQPPAGLQFPFWIVILAGILGLILVVLLSYCLYRGIKEHLRRRKKPEKILSEDEIALSDFLKLHELGLLEKGEFKRHYFRISEILKKYIGGRYQFDALESTTGEMLETLRSRKSSAVIASESVISDISFLFEKLDLVKFTDHIPEMEESSQILGKAKEFVVATRRVPVILNSSGLNSLGVENHAHK
ncbi:MAG: hypothetical protein ABIQ95_14215 [Bdellovibrionia bacterium]